MTRSLLKSVLKLSKAERILLAERLWDSVVDDDVTISLTKVQRSELEKRLSRVAETGPQGDSWAAVKSRITRRAKR